MPDAAFAVSFFGALFAIMNPFANLPVFLGLTDGWSAAARRRAALRVALFSAVMCAVIALAGGAILSFFGVSIDAFRMAGGLVLAMIGLKMLNGADSDAHHGALAEKAAQAQSQDVSFYPMTFPVLVGPGTIATLTLYAHRASGAAEMAAYAAVVAAVLALVGVTLFFAGAIGAHLSAMARSIMTRLMGMILLAIAVEMVGAGARALLPGLG